MLAQITIETHAFTLTGHAQNFTKQAKRVVFEKDTGLLTRSKRNEEYPERFFENSVTVLAYFRLQVVLVFGVKVNGVS